MQRISTCAFAFAVGLACNTCCKLAQSQGLPPGAAVQCAERTGSDYVWCLSEVTDGRKAPPVAIAPAENIPPAVATAENEATRIQMHHANDAARSCADETGGNYVYCLSVEIAKAQPATVNASSNPRNEMLELSKKLFPLMSAMAYDRSRLKALENERTRIEKEQSGWKAKLDAIPEGTYIGKRYLPSGNVQYVDWYQELLGEFLRLERSRLETYEAQTTEEHRIVHENASEFLNQLKQQDNGLSAYSQAAALQKQVKRYLELRSAHEQPEPSAMWKLVSLCFFFLVILVAVAVHVRASKRAK